MAESSRFWTTNNSGDGPSGGYSMANWYDYSRKLFGMTAGEGILAGVDSELAVSGAASPVSIAAGAAMVYGYFYENTTAVTVAVSTPAATAGFRVVLEASWAAQTVRAKVYQSASGVSTPPAVVQTPGTTWQITLATGTITNTGVITLTDARTWAHFSSKVKQAMLDAGAITNVEVNAAAAIAYSKLALANSIGNGDIAPAAAIAYSKLNLAAAILNADINAAAAIAYSKLSLTGAIQTTDLANLIVTNAKLAASAVDDAKAGNRIPRATYHQNSSYAGVPANWDNIDVGMFNIQNVLNGNVLVQVGAVQYQISPAASYFLSPTITFPTAYSANPLVFLSSSIDNFICVLNMISSTGFVIKWREKMDTTVYQQVNARWLAIGPG